MCACVCGYNQQVGAWEERYRTLELKTNSAIIIITSKRDRRYVTLWNIYW